MTKQLSLSNILTKSFFLSLTLMCTVFITNAQEEKSAAALYNEGLAFLKAKDYASGLPAMEKALEKGLAEENEKVVTLSKKNGAIAAYNVAKAKVKDKDYEGAKSLYNKGIEMNPTYSSNYSGLANVLNKEGKKVEAVDQYLLAAKIATDANKESKATKAYKKINVIVSKLYVAKEYDQVITLGKKALEATKLPSLNYYVSRAMLEKGDKEGALEQATAAITNTPEGNVVEDKFYVAQAKAYEALGNKAEAIKAYEMVKEGQYLEQAQYQLKKLKS